MQLYRVEYLEDEQLMVEWFGTQKDVATFRRLLKAHPDRTLWGYDLVDVPTRKPELLAWLNTNATT